MGVMYHPPVTQDWPFGYLNFDLNTFKGTVDK